MSYIRYTRSKDRSEVWESVDTDPAAKDSDYQFLLSLEENRKATIFSRVSTIITCASLLWAMAIIIPEVFSGETFSLPKSILEFAILIYSFVFLICLVCSALALCEKKNISDNRY